MPTKMISGCIALLLGVVLICYGFYGRYKIHDARSDVAEVEQFIPENSAKRAVSSRVHAKINSYELPVALCFIGGVALIVVGGVLIYSGRRS